ncbi:MAG: NAD-dependent epimerase/dehydratase family protein [Eubacterium sp.]|nr:NAD-dependent epimerase/dehydratase family protein [Eubacterium sp.]
MKKVLLIGGSYFAGRVFVMLASRADYDITVMNRGRYSMASYPNTKDVVCDRHDYEKMKTLQLDEEYDAIIDFCAYEPGDIKGIFNNLPSKFKRYIYLSTADVTARNGNTRDEFSPLLGTAGSGEVDDYLFKKMLLEKELVTCAEGREGTEVVILRPSFIYGPYNYAPRETFYIQRIYQGQPIPHPTNATGKFSMVYVKDVAIACMLCVEKEDAANQIFVLAGEEVLDYDSFLAVLKEIADRPFTVEEMTVEEVEGRQIPLPFPLTIDEDEVFSGKRISQMLGLAYSPFKESLKITYDGLKNVYIR